MARRARRGLANLSDSEGDECKQEVCSTKENSVSLFDTKVFTDNVLKKIREEEAKVTSFDDHSDIADPNKTEQPLNEGTPLYRKLRRSSDCLKAAKRSKLVEICDSGEDDDDDLEELLKSTSFVATQVTTHQRSTEFDHKDSDVQESKGDGGERSPEGIGTEDDQESLLNASVDENDLYTEDRNDYRVLVKHLGVEESIWVRLKESDTMQRVFDETRKATGLGVTLMIDVNGEREEVFPSHTATDLKMSVERCAVVYSYPAPSESTFTLKIVTTNRRATREIACDVNESFAQIFRRYCEENNLSRDCMVFKFDGEILAEAETPRGLDMEAGEQIEAHPTLAARPPDSEAEATGCGRRTSPRIRNK